MVRESSHRRLPALAARAGSLLLGALALSCAATMRDSAVTGNARRADTLEVSVPLRGEKRPTAGNLSAAADDPAAKPIRVRMLERKSVFRFPQEQDLFITESRLLVRALDANGNVLYHETLPDPRLLRAEEFGAGEGGAHRVIRVDAELVVDIPQLEGIHSLEILQPGWDGADFSLSVLRKDRLEAQELARGVKQRSKADAEAGAGHYADAPAAESDKKEEKALVRKRGIDTLPLRVGAEKIMDNGPAWEKVDIVFVGDGYTREQMNKWREDAAVYMDRLFEKEPFRSYRKYFNVHRLDVAGRESGAGWNTPDSKRNALGSHFNCYNIQRLLCVNYGRVRSLLKNTYSAVERDITVVIVNDNRYGGAGGAYSTTSLHPSGVDVLVHEIGHSFAGFADEYDYGRSGSDCTPNREPSAPNVTIESDPSRVKWRHIPGTGLYEGAYYCKKGFYRPYPTSKMRVTGGKWQPLHMRVWESRIRGIATGG